MFVRKICRWIRDALKGGLGMGLGFSYVTRRRHLGRSGVSKLSIKELFGNNEVWEILTSTVILAHYDLAISK